MVVLTKAMVLSKARVASLDQVKNLNYWGSDLTDISILQQLPNLEVLSLSVNNITTLRPIMYCTKLKELYMRRNQIFDLEQIVYLKKLHKLQLLWLSENPCADDDNYRYKVILNLPQLRKLDNINIPPEEVKLAESKGTILQLSEEESLQARYLGHADGGRSLSYEPTSDTNSADCRRKSPLEGQTSVPNVPTSLDTTKKKTEGSLNSLNFFDFARKKNTHEANSLAANPKVNEVKKKLGSDTALNRIGLGPEPLLQETSVQKLVNTSSAPTTHRQSPNTSLVCTVEQTQLAPPSRVLSAVFLLMDELSVQELGVLFDRVQSRITQQMDVPSSIYFKSSSR